MRLGSMNPLASCKQGVADRSPCSRRPQRLDGESLAT
jgi:hypothetical protein